MTIPILVTGGAGYVGSHACKALAAAGYLPISYDNLSRGHAAAVKWGPLESGDISNSSRFRKVVQQYRPAAVLHFASYAYIAESMENPDIYYENNVVGSLRMLQSMREEGLDRIVFSSTCATYGIPEKLPVDERSPQVPINPYGASKLAVEKMIADFGRAYGLRSIMLRYFNAAGADPDGEIGENHDPEPHIIPRCLMAAAGEIPHVEVLGTDYPTPDGTAIRDYVHVSDLATAHVAALGLVLKEAGPCPAAINLGSGKGFSVQEIIKAIERITGRSVPVRRMPRRPGDPPALVADSSLAAQILNFRRRFTEINEIIDTAWRWHQRRHNNPDRDD